VNLKRFLRHMGVLRTMQRHGSGRTPRVGEEVTVHYVGTLAADTQFKKAGTQFDSSRERKKPLVFVIGVGAVIKGWDEGIMEMSLGEISTLRVSSDYGYGERGMSPVIPPNAELSFEVELLAIGKERAPGGSVCEAIPCLVS
jgi:FKBP-type peptidyl-prolyl cis-trans isomerase